MRAAARVVAAEEAVAAIPSGATVAVGGFVACGAADVGAGWPFRGAGKGGGGWAATDAVGFPDRSPLSIAGAARKPVTPRSAKRRKTAGSVE